MRSQSKVSSFPISSAAVCGGNVWTSQRIVDVVLKAFHAAAASQGCTKQAFYNILSKRQSNKRQTVTSHLELAGMIKHHYEVFWHLALTNFACLIILFFRQLDILERRYPVLLHQFRPDRQVLENGMVVKGSFAQWKSWNPCKYLSFPR